MKARPSSVRRINQAVLDEPGANVVLHELATRNWPLTFELEAGEHPIGYGSIRCLAVPLTQKLSNASLYGHRLAARLALAVAHVAVKPSTIQVDDPGIPINVSPL